MLKEIIMALKRESLPSMDRTEGAQEFAKVERDVVAQNQS
jgi:hypothetical protein